MAIVATSYDYRLAVEDASGTTYGDVALELFDASGRRRVEPHRARLEAGRQRVTLGIPETPPAGLYWVRLTHPAGMRTARVTWLR